MQLFEMLRPAALTRKPRAGPHHAGRGAVQTERTDGLSKPLPYVDVRKRFDHATSHAQRYVSPFSADITAKVESEGIGSRMHKWAC